MNSAITSNPGLHRFKKFYANLRLSELAELDNLYTADVRFRDPVHCIEGLPSLHRYFEKLCRNLTECRFEYLDEMVESHRAYIKWDMCFRHPKLRNNQVISVRGASQILFSDTGIHYQEDFYDLGAMLYDHVPVISSLTSFLKRRLDK